MQELLRRAQKGDKYAFDVLYKEFLTPIYRYIYFRVGQKQEAEDIAQVVFIKAWTALGDFEIRGDHSFISWCYAIARNLIIDYWKKKKPILSEVVGEEMEQVDDFRDMAAADFDLKIQEGMIREAIQKLSPDQQEVIILKFINDRSNQEITELIGKSEEAVRALSSRGIKSLRELLKDKHYEF